MANFTTTEKKKEKSTLDLKPVAESDSSSAALDTKTAYQSAPASQRTADKAYNQMANAYNNRTQLSDYTAFADVEKLYNDIMNAPEFSYDFNADQTYKNLADRYTAQGQMAMKDTMGQAAALNGGYGTSYSQMAGQQVYNQYMQELADYIPQLEEKAYARYQDEMARLSDQYNMALGRDETAYSRYADIVNQESNDINTLYNLWAQLQGQANEDRNYNLSAAEFEESKEQNDITNALNDKYYQLDIDKFDYTKEQDAIANALAEKQYQLDAGALAYDQNQSDKEFLAYLAANGLTTDANGNYIVDKSSPYFQSDLLSNGYTLDENGNVVVDRNSPEMQAYLLENGLKFDDNGNIVFDQDSSVYATESDQPSFSDIKTAAKTLYKNNGSIDYAGLITAVEYVTKFNLNDNEADQIAIDIGYNSWDEMAADYVVAVDYVEGNTANVPGIKYYG